MGFGASGVTPSVLIGVWALYTNIEESLWGKTLRFSVVRSCVFQPHDCPTLVAFMSQIFTVQLSC